MPLQPPMTYSQAGQRITQLFESCKLRAYPDSGGKPTIGWGHTRGVALGLTCIQAQADVWALEDEGYAVALVNDLVDVPLSQPEFDALVDFEYNTGGLKGSTMLAKLNAGDIVGAAVEFPKWDHVHGAEIAGLLRRRLAEQTEFSGAD